MKDKSDLTAEQAVLLGVKLDKFKTLGRVKRELNSLDEMGKLLWSSVMGGVDNPEGVVELEENNRKYRQLKTNFDLACVIKNALLEEIDFAENDSSELELAQPVYCSGDPDNLDTEKTTLTKASVAKWLLNYNQTMAFNIEPELERKPKVKEKLPKVQPNSNQLNKKTENTYLKVIAALSEALINGLTGIKNKDAEAVLSVLDQKGIHYPVGKKTLANYLGEAKEL